MCVKKLCIIISANHQLINKNHFEIELHQLEKHKLVKMTLKWLEKMLFEQQNNINKIQTKLDEDITNKALTELIDYLLTKVKEHNYVVSNSQHLFKIRIIYKIGY